MSTLILTPILATTLFFFAQINNQKLHSLPEAPVQQEEIKELKTEPTHDLIALEWLKVMGLTSFVSLMWLAVLHCNRPKTLSKDNHYDFEEENYFG